LTSFWLFVGSFSLRKLLLLSLVETSDDYLLRWSTVERKAEWLFHKESLARGLDAHYCCCCC
jgi:hypothetical protein